MSFRIAESKDDIPSVPANASMRYSLGKAMANLAVSSDLRTQNKIYGAQTSLIDRKQFQFEEIKTRQVKECDMLAESFRHPEHLQGRPDGKHGSIQEHVTVRTANVDHYATGAKEPIARLSSTNHIITDLYVGDVNIQSKSYKNANTSILKLTQHWSNRLDKLDPGKFYQSVIPKDQYQRCLDVYSGKIRDAWLKKDLDKFMALPIYEGKSLQECLLPHYLEYKDIDINNLGPLSEQLMERITISYEKNMKTIRLERAETLEAHEKKVDKIVTKSPKAIATSAATGFGVSAGMTAINHLMRGNPEKWTSVEWAQFAKVVVQEGVMGGIGSALSQIAGKLSPLVEGVMEWGREAISVLLDLGKKVIDVGQAIGKIILGAAKVAISTAASVFSQILIPIPVLGSFVGMAIGTLLRKLFSLIDKALLPDQLTLWIQDFEAMKVRLEQESLIFQAEYRAKHRKESEEFLKQLKSVDEQYWRSLAKTLRNGLELCAKDEGLEHRVVNRKSKSDI